jgi:hypothetical protein
MGKKEERISEGLKCFSALLETVSGALHDPTSRNTRCTSVRKSAAPMLLVPKAVKRLWVQAGRSSDFVPVLNRCLPTPFVRDSGVLKSDSTSLELTAAGTVPEFHRIPFSSGFVEKPEPKCAAKIRINRCSDTG